MHQSNIPLAKPDQIKSLSEHYFWVKLPGDPSPLIVPKSSPFILITDAQGVMTKYILSDPGKQN